ncbi:unnamed protein product [Lymnaea stagnalis]|uniref:Transmembrane protein n=1 Tax=Lymnaea stagnalis TaxID=6523 RepID=A0AAV2HNY7_LYMST
MAVNEKQAPVSIPTCFSEKRVLVVWIACFGILIVLSFFVFVPVAVSMENAGNNCYLYSDSKGFGTLSVCSYCVASAIIFLCLCGLRLLILVIKVTRFSSKLSDKVYEWVSVWGVHLIIFILDLMMLILILVTACLISAGLSKICELYDGRDKCSSSKGVELPNGENGSFYKALSFSEASAWFTFCFWLLVIVAETYIGWKSGSFSELVTKVRSLSARKSDTSASQEQTNSQPEPPPMAKY